MTVSILNYMSDDLNVVEVAKNGVKVQHGEEETYLVHYHNDKKVVLQVSTGVEQLSNSWKHLLATAKQILALLSEVWVACSPTVKAYCSHCLFIRDPNPAYEVNPKWFCLIDDGNRSVGKSLAVHEKVYSGIQPVYCRRHAASRNDSVLKVPTPLKFPCKSQGNKGH